MPTTPDLSLSFDSPESYRDASLTLLADGSYVAVWVQAQQFGDPFSGSYNLTSVYWQQLDANRNPMGDRQILSGTQEPEDEVLGVSVVSAGEGFRAIVTLLSHGNRYAVNRTVTDLAQPTSGTAEAIDLPDAAGALSLATDASGVDVMAVGNESYVGFYLPGTDESLPAHVTVTDMPDSNATNVDVVNMVSLVGGGVATLISYQSPSGAGLVVARMQPDGMGMMVEPVAVGSSADEVVTSHTQGSLVALPEGGYAVAWTQTNMFDNVVQSPTVLLKTWTPNDRGALMPGLTEVVVSMPMLDHGAPLDVPETSITALSNGDLLVAWTAFDPDTGWDIRAQRVDGATGALEGAPVLVHEDASGNQAMPQLETLPDGSVVGLWVASSDGAQLMLGTVEVPASVEPPVAGEDFALGADAIYYFDASLTQLSDGRYVATWMQTLQGVGQQAVWQLLDEQRLPVGEPQEFSGAMSPQTRVDSVSVVANATGGFNVLLKGAGDAGFQSVYATLENVGTSDGLVLVRTSFDEFVYKTYDLARNAEGVTLAASTDGFDLNLFDPVTGNNLAVLEAGDYELGSIDLLQIQALADGSFAALFSGGAGSGNALGVVRLFGGDGANVPVADFVAPIQYTPGGQFKEQVNASLTALANGGYAVSWTEVTPAENDNMPSFTVRVRTYGPDYAPGPVVTVATPVVDTTEYLADDFDLDDIDFPHTSVTALPNGDLLVAWEQYDPVAGSLDILVQRVNGTTGALEGEPVLLHEDATGSQERPVLLALPDGTVAGLWMESTNGQVRLMQGTLDQDIPEPQPPVQLFLEGTAEADTLNGDALEDVLDGLAGDDVLNGMAGDDVLLGGDGDDTLDGGAGTDVLIGGTGDDTYVIDSADDVVVEAEGEGTDTLQSASLSLDLTDLENLENAVLTGDATLNATGNAGANALTGNSAGNTLTGGEGADTLDGGEGADTLVGGLGDDVYQVDSALDVVTEAEGEGTDTVRTSVSLTLGDHIENGELLAGELAVALTGNDLDNTLTGNDGANSLSGGLGDDTLAGGLGDDTYVVDSADDVVTELAEQGNDTVEASISYTLGDHVENATATAEGLTLTGNAGNNRLTAHSSGSELRGGAGVDTLQGDAGNDTLNGGSGNDSMAGGAGDDVYDIDNPTMTYPSYGWVGPIGSAVWMQVGSYTIAGDTVTELADGGDDTVRSSNVSLNLANFANVENITLLDSVAATEDTPAEGIDLWADGSADANVLTGNSGNNRLAGHSGDDTLVGGLGNDTMVGGTGADAMSGGKGDDTYYVDNVGDTVVEAADEGHDTVYTTVGLTLGAGVEDAVLEFGTVLPEGATSIDLTGNAAANLLWGSLHNNLLAGLDGDDTLYGFGGDDTLAGGEGRDRLEGSEGNDTYVLEADIDGVNVDTVFEMANNGSDTLQTGSLSLDLANFSHVENIALTGSTALNATGDAQANILSGNGGANSLSGGAGDDTLLGGAGNDTLDGGEGADSLAGGAGDDVYHLDNAGDTVTELADEGSDTVVSGLGSINVASFAHVENASLLGSGNFSLTGNAAANVLTGNAGNNLLNGGAGDDSLIGAGGNDTLNGGDGNDALDGGEGTNLLIGGRGDDTYILATSADRVVELSNQGNDTARAAFTADLANLANIENLVLTGPGNFNATGNDQANVLTGNSGNNLISGLGGNDSIDGGDGVDTASYADKVEAVSIDLSSGSISVLVGGVAEDSLANIENLIGGAGADSLIGDLRNNRLEGGLGNDTISGGLGRDVLLGGDGNDWLVGNQGADRLLGNQGNDVLEGRVGADTLTGGLGQDKFVFNTVLGETEIDTITDFQVRFDKIVLDDDIFRAFGISGTVEGVAVASSQFELGTEATTAQTRLVYDQNSGALWYDADGSGAAAATQVALIGVSTHAALSASDFVLVA